MKALERGNNGVGDRAKNWKHFSFLRMYDKKKKDCMTRKESHLQCDT